MQEVPEKQKGSLPSWQMGFSLITTFLPEKMQNGWDSEVLMTEEHAHCAQIHTKNEH